MAALLIGYDVEAMGRPEVTRAFLRKAEDVHREHPCTLFLVGKVIEENLADLERLAGNPMFDFQQHTYSHRLLKTVCMEKDGEITVYRGMPFAEIEDEVGRTCDLLKKHFGKECLGLTAPYCYYRGLADRPDILEVLHRLGIRFTRTYGRDEHDFQPVAFEIQPFWYEPQGYDDILEFPIHGWQDVYWRGINGWENVEGYTRYLLQCLDCAAERDLVWSHGSHDWSSVKDDPDMTIIRAVLDAADRRGVRVQSYLDFYNECANRAI
ncbi:MAG: polysaccharide deacetylase family protein [Armatimonadetes bacterium]|nr:polysaccharide deacetylase family protein [Armatimonadota bacterium]